MSHKSAILTLNGPLEDVHIIQRLIEKGYFHLCTDGAYDTLKKENITPHAIIGDMDSILTKPNDCQLIFIPDQEQNDFEKALQWLIHENYSDVHISGFPGGRLDHELVNFTLLYYYSRQIEIYAYEGNQLAHIVKAGNYTFKGQKGDIISLIALTAAENVSLQGAQYRLESVTLMPGSRGLSNQFLEETVSLTFSKGKIIVVVPYEHNI
ncbi:MAG: thiamine diphosphokinase [Candidatus Marinimicrobia bacterium]|nr:thiamine diphosphokinase [Candidatus Neomarinimicrobiota bacterium]MDD5582964.1 thiamine diphosphokinase [Candidatus Neomarinimicrobiota bacterium]